MSLLKLLTILVNLSITANAIYFSMHTDVHEPQREMDKISQKLSQIKLYWREKIFLPDFDQLF